MEALSGENTDEYFKAMDEKVHMGEYQIFTYETLMEYIYNILRPINTLNIGYHPYLN